MPFKSLPPLLLFCGTLFCFYGSLHAQKTLQPKEKREYALKLLQKYNAEGWKIIKQVDSMALHPPFDRFAEGDTEFDVRNAVGTMVHEMNHSYGALLAWKMKPKEAKNYMCYYLADDDHRLVRYTPVFPTEQMGRTIPKNLRTFRFETYIFNPKEKIPLTSNVLGIYGLLDEWVAYYQGTLTDVKMHCWYEENTPGNAEDWYDYFSNVGSAINAHQEFRFYCLAYLLHAQRHHPDMYKEMMQNQEMVETFLKVNELFSKLLLNYDIIKDGVFTKLRAKGVKIIEDDEWIFLNRYGAGNYLTEYKILEKEMAKPAYQQMLQNLKNANKIALYKSPQPQRGAK
jgi:hypothetical protein